MTARAKRSPVRVFGVAMAAALFAGILAHGSAEARYLVFVATAGLATGGLGLLMIGHVMSEEWLKPIRAEAEAAALTAPLLLGIAVPLAFSLDALFPWAGGAAPALPPGRAAYLDAPFFLARGAVCLLIWILLALWIARTERVRRASAIGLALLAPTATLAANDWVLSREPFWWSSLFGFAFAVSQLLAALAGAILISLVRPEHPGAVRMQSLERALLTLALLTFWIWFVHFLVVWLGNLPDEAAWYGVRSGPWLWPLVGVAVPALVVAVAILIPPGFGRRTMIAGSALLLLHHVAHMVWLLGPAARPGSVTGGDALVALGLAGVWAGWFAFVLRLRPSFEAEARHEA